MVQPVLASVTVCAYTAPIGAVRRAWSIVRVGCVFSESLNDMRLGRPDGHELGGRPAREGGSAGWRSTWPLRLFGSVASAVLNDGVSTFFPADCRLCEMPLIRAGRVPVCEGCLELTQRQGGELCARCGEALGMESERFVRGLGGDALLCTPCRAVPPPFERAVAFGIYGAELRELLHMFKYERVEALAGLLGAMLAEAIAELAPELEQVPKTDWLMVPVPLFRAKRRDRGFNQAAMLAEAAARELRKRGLGYRLTPAFAVLRRVRATESQFGLTPHQRRANVRGAFAVTDRGAVKGRSVLLIDDIYTTGATVRVCAEVLRRAGAERVLVATLARAQPETVALWNAVPRGHA